jgi:hypothetical protein
MQTPQLRDDKEQKADDRKAGIQQVLPLVPEAHQTQGNAVALQVSGRQGENREQLEKAEAIPDRGLVRAEEDDLAGQE